MQEPDYHDICMSIAGIIAHGDKPLTQMQTMSLVGSVSIWLKQRDDRIATLELVREAQAMQIAGLIENLECVLYTAHPRPGYEEADEFNIDRAQQLLAELRAGL